MSIEVQAGKSTRIRAAAAAHPTLPPEAIAERLGLRLIEVRRALAVSPARRVRSTAR